MLRRLLLVLSVGLLAIGVTPAAAAPATGFTGIVALDNCSGSLVRLPGSRDSDPALVLTNGHCDENGMPAPGEVITAQPSRRTMDLLGSDGARIGKLRATQIVYGTMTDTDVLLYRLDSSYRQIAHRTGGKPLTLAASPADAGTPIDIRSGYFARTWSCDVDRIVYSLREADWTWHASIRYTPECDTGHGTSGSPIVDRGTGQIVGINNTGNDNGYSCTFDNPCEVDENGVVTVRQGRSYGQQTYGLTSCVGYGNQLELDRPGCLLPKPAGLKLPIPLPA
ncbi:trypsin-like peptidase domain-containing protein [Amycolatopsis acidicola]|uniref:Trypsin-like peptidase domain-containing protein n=1 Tax=Amycolatopsis acidicola TaxID=2596893 RepID=A0A5N0UW69_9PSEU|nr:trypsin-like peptidase domain-containing protein [Amycolatopsis acidicola]KAA9154922.1 trypsin-like peptidase domain-containing protein [Amycolatopsis acidicola]